MPKNIFQDITPQKRSIRDIPIRSNKKATAPYSGGKGVVGFSGGNINKDKKGGSKLKWWLGVVVIVVVIFVSLSTVFAGAKVVITPKQESAEFNAIFTAIRDNIKTNIEGVPFRLMTISLEASQVTSNFEEKEVDKKASGEIIIFNDYGTASQRLIKNTRFETPDGLIYRVLKSVVVPGKENGTPGSVEVTVYADVPGGDYNIDLVDFTIPGFQGTDRFSKFMRVQKLL